MPTPVIIDTDPGIDDVVALALALRSPEIEVVAITTSYGNATLDLTTRNAHALLHLLGLDHTRLTYRHNGRDFRLTDVAGKVIDKIVA